MFSLSFAALFCYLSGTELEVLGFHITSLLFYCLGLWCAVKELLLYQASGTVQLAPCLKTYSFS